MGFYTKELRAKAAFKAGHFEEAIRFIYEGLELDPNKSIQLYDELFISSKHWKIFWNTIDRQIKIELLATIGVSSISILPTREQFEKLINIESLNLPYRIEEVTLGTRVHFKPYWVCSITSLIHFKNLKFLNLSGQGNIKDYNVLEYCKKLVELNLSFTNFKDLKPLQKIVGLKILNLYDDSFNKKEIDLAPISNSQLVELDISGHKIKDFKELDKISSLKRLSLKATNIENLNQIKNLKSLSILFVTKSKIFNLYVYPHFPKLTELYAETTDAQILDKFYTRNPQAIILNYDSPNLYKNNSILQALKNKYLVATEMPNKNDKEFKKLALFYDELKTVKEKQDYPKIFFPFDFLQNKDKFRKLEIKKPTFTTNQLSVKGISEKFFLKKLNEIFTTEILSNAVLVKGEKLLPKVPDFIYQDEEYNIFIDIEIDEPYTWKHTKITHYNGYDYQRNLEFLHQNWFVLRFTEEQIVKYPNDCIIYIANFRRYIVESLKNVANKIDLTFPFPQKSWEQVDCNNLFISDYRKSYLKEIIEGNSISKISEVLSLNNSTSTDKGRWEQLSPKWKTLIIESVFARNSSNQSNLDLTDKDLSYLMSIEELNFTGAQPHLVKANLNKISFILEDIEGISDLLFLKNIKSIRFDHNQIVDFTPLSCFYNLEALYLQYNPVKSLEFLTSFKKLKFLYLDHTEVNTIDVLKNLSKLTIISLNYAGIYGISSLFNFTNPYLISLKSVKLKKSQLEKLKELYPETIIQYTNHRSYIIDV